MSADLVPFLGFAPVEAPVEAPAGAPPPQKALGDILGAWPGTAEPEAPYWRAPRQRSARTQEGAGAEVFGERELQFVNAIAAHHYRYGQLAEALALTQMTLRYDPRNRQTLHLLAQILAASGDWAAAEQTLDAIERLSVGPLGAEDRGVGLLSAFVALKRQSLSAAQQLYRRFISLI